MDAVLNLLESLVNVFWSVLDVVRALVLVVLPWLPLLAWVGFWAFAVNWAKTLPIILRGGFLGVLLLMLATVLVWAAVAPPPDGNHMLFGLAVSNHVGKFVYVTILACIAFLCGSAQLAGTFGCCAVFADEPEQDDHGHGGHGDSHGHHDDHGHGHGQTHAVAAADHGSH